MPRMVLRLCYGMSGTGLGIAAIVLHLRYGSPGTDFGYAATRKLCLRRGPSGIRPLDFKVLYEFAMRCPEGQRLTEEAKRQRDEVAPACRPTHPYAVSGYRPARSHAIAGTHTGIVLRARTPIWFSHRVSSYAFAMRCPVLIEYRPTRRYAMPGTHMRYRASQSGVLTNMCR
eukprot:966879-Rhodomonas_salina.1